MVWIARATQPFDHWEFASGTPEQVHKVAEFFGLKYWTESGQIVHALVTVLIGARMGKWPKSIAATSGNPPTCSPTCGAQPPA